MKFAKLPLKTMRTQNVNALHIKKDFNVGRKSLNQNLQIINHSSSRSFVNSRDCRQSDILQMDDHNFQPLERKKALRRNFEVRRRKNIERVESQNFNYQQRPDEHRRILLSKILRVTSQGLDKYNDKFTLKQNQMQIRYEKSVSSASLNSGFSVDSMRIDEDEDHSETFERKSTI